MKSETPFPAVVFRLFRWCLPRGEADYVLAAMREVYEEIHRTEGRRAARRWFRGQFLRSLPAFINDRVDWSIIMLGKDLKVAWRDLRKHKVYSFITVSGLAVGAACALLISLYVNHELNYDAYHRDGDRIFRLLVKADFPMAKGKPMAGTSELAAPTLKLDFPEVESAARVQALFRPPVFRSGSTVSAEDDIFYVDPEIFGILTIPFVHGGPDGTIDRPGTILLTESLAAKYFGRRNPVGETLLVNNNLMEVTGVVRDSRADTHWKYRGLISYKTFEPTIKSPSWSRYDPRTYLKIKFGTDLKAFSAKVVGLSQPYLKTTSPADAGQEHFLQSVRSIHMNLGTAFDDEAHGNPGALFLLSGLALVILLLAGLNFVNLTTARAAGRAKEVGVRKTVGAERPRLIRQFLGESFLLTLIAVVFGLGLAGGLLGLFNRFVESRFVFADFFRPGMLPVEIGLVLIIGLAAGMYPAFVLSSFRPVSALRKDASIRLKGGRLRRILVVGQFSIAVALVAVTLSMNGQIRFMKNKPLGFEKDRKIVVVFPGGAGSLPSRIPGDRQATVAQELSRHPSVRSATLSSTVPGRGFYFEGTRLLSEGSNQSRPLRYLNADPNFLEDYGLGLVAGRPISPNAAEREVLVNETAQRIFGWKTPEEALGRRLKNGRGEIEIVGVVRDFHLEGLQKAINPLVIGQGVDRYHLVTLTTDAVRPAEILDFIRRTWAALIPDAPLNYFFLDEEFARQYAKEDRTAVLFSVFSLLGILIACLGVFGLASFLAQKRTKEIGIRKVLGASVPGILGLLSREFAVAVMIAAIVAWPGAYLGVTRWLQNFAFRKTPNPGTFLISGLLVMIVAMLSVVGQTTRAARSNPVESLRSE
jgi:putative ABC transport system permease protein